MKWFHQECAAKHDPKLQTLGASHGAEGLGIFWGLLEEIGQLLRAVEHRFFVKKALLSVAQVELS